MVALVFSVLVAAAPAWDYTPLRAPLGFVGDVVGPPPSGGVEGGEKAVTLQLPGCDRPQTINLSRFLSGASLAGSQLQAWLESKGPGAPEKLEERLFGKHHRLVETLAKAARARPAEQGACTESSLAKGFALLLTRAPVSCKPAKGPLGTYWFVDADHPRQVSAAIHIAAADEKAPDRCRPRLSAVLFDTKGIARLRYHADFGGVLEAELLGHRCQAAAFVFEPQTNAFRATPRSVGPGCQKAR